MKGYVVRGASIVALTLALCASAQQQQDRSMEMDFQNPPEAAKPRVWWHWMSGNVSKEGITADLEWMHRVGIGGMQMFDGDLGVARYIEKPVIWMTPEWKDAFHHAGAEAERLGLEMSMAASGGWSETAGPWVKPEAAMKKVVWSETHLRGPQKFQGKLPEPPRVNGPFQSIAVADPPSSPMVGGASGIPRPPRAEPLPDPTFYADTVVLAYRLPAAESDAPRRAPKITASDPSFSGAALMDGDYATSSELRFTEGRNSEWVQLEYPQALSVRSVTIAFPQPASRQIPQMPNGDLSYSQDGSNWIKLISLPDSPQYVRAFSARTFSFAPISARFFRLTLEQVQLTADQLVRGLMPPASYRIAEIALNSSPRISFFEDKASFGTFVSGAHTTTPDVTAEDAVPLSQIVDLTGKMRPDGSLNWQVPEGHWAVVRMGYSLTGKKNHPATPEATGFEVDKLSSRHVSSYMKTYTDMVSNAVAPNYGKSFRYFLMDSWEAGQENWTEDMLAEFKRRRGYDPTPYLLTLTGRIVGSAKDSDAFLWDFRRTIAEMLAENHYKLATEFLGKQKIGLYAEAMGISLPTTGDGLLNKGQVTIPMGEFWTPIAGVADFPAREADVLEAVSAGHIYGKNIIATESFTSNPSTPGWGQTPFYLKQLADQNFARGVNRIVFHTSDHQPFTDDKHKPGITLGYYGQHYSRNITWAEQAVAWNTYLARCSYMEQSGRPVVDVAYFYGEGAPVTVPYWKEFSPAVPSSFSRDYVNSDVLLNRATVANGDLVLSGSMRYRVLVIPDEFDQLSVQLVRKLSELVKAGAIVAAPRVKNSPSLADKTASSELRSLSLALWGSDTASRGTHIFGEGKIYWGTPLETVLAKERVDPDFTFAPPTSVAPYDYPSPKTTAEVVWNHRRVADKDIYFVANQRMRTEDVVVHFRVAGKSAELWHPDTGVIEPIRYESDGSKTTLTLHLAPEESVFIVFRGGRTPGQPTTTHATKELLTITNPWKVAFPPNLGAPPQIELNSLTSWTASADPGVKYFSGTATYAGQFNLPDGWDRPTSKVILDLGRVREFAQVTVNGEMFSEILWKPPFTLDVTSALKNGSNAIEIKVTNLWPNRIIGDQQPDVTEKYTFTVYGAYKADSPLVESGLFGPVKLLSLKE
jgi:alpha-L-rhamnosidase/F5/8 type C domain